jgi:hypothetical protein
VSLLMIFEKKIILLAFFSIVLLVDCICYASEYTDQQISALKAHCPAAATWIANEESAILGRPQSQISRAKAVEFPRVRLELLQLVALDREARADLKKTGYNMKSSAADHVSAVDEANLPKVRAIVRKYGFPTVEQVGEDGAEAAWVLAYDAVQDPSLQLRVVNDLIGKNVRFVNNYQLAVTSDRANLKLQRHQPYGSQLQAINGEWKIHDIDSITKVDGRRRRLNLMPITDAACMENVLYPPIDIGR